MPDVSITGTVEIMRGRVWPFPPPPPGEHCPPEGWVSEPIALVAGGRPSKGTPRDKRLGRNKPKK